MAPADFYDDLSSVYHLMFENWEASIARQSAALSSLLIRECGPPEAIRILDCACGIGTQALGLAAAGFRIAGSDISPRAIDRARSEASSRRLDVPLFVADMRDLSPLPGSQFDVVICMDNALPHLEDDNQIVQAACQVLRKLRPGGKWIAGIRDYDRLIEEKPGVQGPALFSDNGRRRIVFQLWDWHDDRRYTFHLYITRQAPSGWETHHGASTYHAVLRAELSAILQTSGFAAVQWLMPEQSGYYQPLFIATAPAQPRSAGSR